MFNKKKIKRGDYEMQDVARAIYEALDAEERQQYEAMKKACVDIKEYVSPDFTNVAWTAARAVVDSFDIRMK